MLETSAPKEVTRAANSLSSRYRGSRVAGAPFVLTGTDVLAYASYRLPATFAAARAALMRVRERLPGWEPETLLDLGAGPGTASWAAASVWPCLRTADLVERDERMIELGRGLMSAVEHAPVADVRWTQDDLAQATTRGMHDVCVLSYALGELDPAARDAVVDRAWKDAGGIVVIVEPGTPAGYQVMLRARAQLIQSGGAVIAPCPHSAGCPMENRDWCHFSCRLPRSRAHRSAKDVSIGYEDEKFSYIAVSRWPASPAHSRIVRHPQIRPGHIHVELCTTRGLEHCIVTKRNRADFKVARHARWGDSFDEVPAPDAPNDSRPSVD